MNGMACCAGMAGGGVAGIVGTVLAGLLGLALLALLVMGTVWLARNLRSGGGGGPGEAVEIARREYAGGRIDRDEFLRRSADLTGTRT